MIGSTWTIRTCLALVGFSLALNWPSACAAGEEHAYRRLAIIASDRVRETGLSDLLTARLAEKGGVELVERDQLEEVMQELEMTALLGASGASQRLKLGRLVRADALVVLSFQERDKRRFMKLVISDCLFGARLCIEFLPYTDDELGELASQCVSLIKGVREQYAHGINYMIGVSPFVSRNLVHDYDHLQAGYAHLLENALTSLPGVAVIEVEEAHAISRELGLDGLELKKRTVPLFVEGEFEILGAKVGRERQVRLMIRISDGRQVRRTIEHGNVSSAEAVELLAGSVPRRIVQLTQEDAGKTLSPKVQYAKLTARADLFTQLGSQPEAVGLREAALLLEPGDVDQRLYLIGDYYHLIRDKSRPYRVLPVYGQGRGGVKKRNAAAWEKSRPEQVDRWRIMLQHIEHVIRRRALNPREARRLMGAAMSISKLYLAPQNCQPSNEIKEEAREFFWQAYSVFPSLNYGSGTIRAAVGRCKYPLPSPGYGSDQWTDERQYDHWTGGAIPVDYGHLYPFTDDPRILDDLYRFLTELTSQERPPIYTVGLVFVGEYSRLNNTVCDGRFTADQVRRLCRRLIESKQPLNSFYGRCQLVSLKLCHKANETIDAEAIREVDALMEFLEKRGHKEKHIPGRANPVVNNTYNSLRNVRRKLSKKLGMAPEKRPMGPPKRKFARFSPTPIIEYDLAPRIRFEPVDGIRARWRDLRKCGDSLDVMWSPFAVYAMAAPGRVREIFVRDEQGNDPIQMVVWDGADIWISTMQSGIWIVSPEGKVLGHVGTAQGLPPYKPVRFHPRKIAKDYALFLHPIEPGKCVAIGKVGKHGRIWFAAISFSRDAPASISCKAEVFFTATKLAADQTDPDDADPKKVFSPAWIKEYSGPKQPTRRLLLVGRQELGGRPQGRRPLAVDLETLEVSVFPARFPSSLLIHPSGRELCCVGGRMLYAGPVTRSGGRGPKLPGIRLFSPPEEGGANDWTSKVLVEHKDTHGLPRLFLTHAGKVYRPGTEWYCVDPKNMQCDRLTKARLPLYHWYVHYGVSAHYGPVAWNNPVTWNQPSRGLVTRGQLFQVKIDDPEPPKPAILYPIVPEQHLERHHRAVEAIFRLGGTVGVRELGLGMIGTAVILSERWKGGDEGLAHLEGLHNLRELCLARAAVSDEGLKCVGRLRNLSSLFLVETKVTNEGLVHLAGLHNLQRLRLEGTLQGNELSDAGLKHLCHLSRLKRLTLWGPGFTEEGLDYLKEVPELRRLTLVDTGIPKAAVRDFRKLKPLTFHVAP